ncbi:MAG TPA: DMT family transporter [Verrucomicrobiae bacterium]|nr:DMT family transporter [Verrucomicrobiae bacterium]
MKRSHLALLLLFNVFWAGTQSAAKALEPWLEPGGIVTLRFGSAAACLWLCWPFLPGAAPRGRDLAQTILMGLIVFVVGHRLQVFGNYLGSAGNSSILTATEPLITSVMATLYLREHITARRWAGFSLGVVGVLLLNGGWRAEVKLRDLGASTIFISSFLCETAYSIMGKSLIERAGVAKILAVALLAGTLVNLGIDGQKTLTAARAMPAHAWLLVAFMGLLCTAIGYALWYVVIREADVNVAAMTIFSQPVAGILIAGFLLREQLHWGQLWGSVAIVLGLFIGLRGTTENPKETVS